MSSFYPHPEDDDLRMVLDVASGPVPPRIATKRICRLALGFLLLLVQINGRGYINEIQLSQIEGLWKNLGFFGNSLYYLAFGIASLFTVTVTEKYGPRGAMLAGTVLTLIWELSFLYLNNWMYLGFNIVGGLGASLSWPAMGYYIERTTNPTDVIRHNALCWGITQFSQILSPLILIVIFYNKGGTDNEFTATARLCVTVLFIVDLLSALIIFWNLPKPDASNLKPKGVMKTLKDTFRLCRTRKMRYFIGTYAHAGFSQALWMAIFPAMISNYKQLSGDGLMNMAIGALSVGVGELTVCVIAFMFVRKYIPKKVFALIFGTLLQIVVAISIFLVFPADANSQVTDGVGYFAASHFVVNCIGFMIGLSDGTWNICIYEATEEYFPEDSLLAFVIFNFVQSLSTCFAFVMISKVPLSVATVAFSMTSIIAFNGYRQVINSFEHN